MVSTACARDLAFLEKAGRGTALVPIKSKEKTSNASTKFYLPGAILSLGLVILQTVWDWNDLKLGYFKRTSEKISYLVFNLALWVASAVGRMAFLLSAHLCSSFLTDVKAYVAEYIPVGAPLKRRRFKPICLITLNILYFCLIFETVWRQFTTTTGSPSGIEAHCERTFILPCEAGLTYAILSIFMNFFSSATLYYLTYFAIVIADLFISILNLFEKDVLSKVDPNYSLTYVEDPVFFILKDGGHTKKRPRSNPSPEKNLHDQFSKLRHLFERFNIAVGTPLVTTCFSDILMFICLMFSMIPKFSQHKNNNYPQFGHNGQGYDNYSYIGNDSTNGYNESLNLNGTAEQFGAGGFLSYIPENDNAETMSHAFHYLIAVLFECRALLLATIGSYLKFKVQRVKESLDSKIHGSSPKPSIGVYTASETQNANKAIAVSVLARFQQWKWELRLVDMVTIDLALLPAMVGTVMTYVVVLLQIRLSEE